MARGKSFRTHLVLAVTAIVILLFFRVVLTVSLNRTAGQDASKYSDALVVVQGAQKLFYCKFWGTDQLSYWVEIEYPAQAVIDEFYLELDKQGWIPLDEDYLNPGLPTSHVRGWTDFVDATQVPNIRVHQWGSDWKNKRKDILVLTLRYFTDIEDSEKIERLYVSIIYVPRSVNRYTDMVVTLWR